MNMFLRNQHQALYTSLIIMLQVFVQGGKYSIDLFQLPIIKVADDGISLKRDTRVEQLAAKEYP